MIPRILSPRSVALVVAFLAVLLLVPLVPHHPLSNHPNITSWTSWIASVAYKKEFLNTSLPSQVHDSWESGVQPLLVSPFATMRSLVVAVALALYTAVAGAQQSSVATSYLSKEVPLAKNNLLANIGPDGSRSQGAKAGVVVASPSKVDPDYVYTWTRDSALVFKSVVESYTRGEDNNLRTKIDQYVDAQAYLQTVSNPSGTISTGGLGEPKFNVNLTQFTGSWGRPQRDGPALRATALIGYSDWLIKNGNTSYAQQNVWPVIKLDLDYTAQYWNYTGFDLWEEINSASFFTTAAQHRALHEGAALAKTLGQNDLATNYETQAGNVLCFQQSYWNSGQGFMTSNTGGGRSGKDANTAIASIHNFDASAGCDATTFQPCSDKALSSLKVYVDAFRSLYPINSGIASNKAVATGRYTEDVYYGGQPWYLTTAAVAEQLYDSIIVWKAQKQIAITSTSLAFFRQFASSVTEGTYTSDSATYTTLLNSVTAFADGFVEVIAKYTPADGALSEQFHRSTGAQLSAVHLTWSYASILTANAARNGYVPESWGAAGLKLPAVCAGNEGPTGQVTFNVKAETVLGENIYITGSIDQLKVWSPDNAIQLSPSNYPTWSVTIAIPVYTRFQYKYIRKGNGKVTWESDPNREFETPASGSASTNDVWR